MNEEAFYESPTFVVAVAFVAFVILAIKPLYTRLIKALDSRSQLIADELAQAKKLRQEAEAVLATYQQKQRESLKEAESILEQTREDARRMAAQAEIDLKAALDKRTKLAGEKIAQAETRAVQDVQNHVVDIAIAAARTLIQEHVSRAGNEEMIRQAAAELERKLH